jgi:predicted nucleotidyltransferase
MKCLHTINEIQQIIQPIAERYGVEKVTLFGSYARGEATFESDVDLRVDCGKIRGYFKLGGFYNELEEQLQVHIDLLTTDALNEDFLRRISKEEVVLYAQ